MKPVLSIEFCTSWGYDQKAVVALAVLVRLFKNDFSEFKVIPSSGGVFEVRFGDKLLFSKKELGRFPEQDEIIELVKKEV